MQQLREFYKTKARENIRRKFNYKSIEQVPRITKVVINVGFGKAAGNKKQIELHMNELELITGQKPVATKAKKSIAGFKIREGAIIGAKVTLRHEYMFGFLSKLIHVSFPRVREFNGISMNAFDKNFNHTFGLQEQLVFPEITYDQISDIRGYNVTVCFKNAKNKEVVIALLAELGWPWRNYKEQGDANG